MDTTPISSQNTFNISIDYVPIIYVVLFLNKYILLFLRHESMLMLYL